MRMLLVSLLQLLLGAANARSVLIAIFSRPENFVKRQLIRSTWSNYPANENFSIKCLFILGHSPNEATQRQLGHERGEQGDLILLPYDDTPGNRAKKLRDTIDLAFNTLKMGFLFKSSDEQMLNVGEIEATLQNHLQGQWESPIYFNLLEQSTLHRLQQQQAHAQLRDPSAYFQSLKNAPVVNDGYLISASIGEWILRQTTLLPPTLPSWVDPADDGMLLKWWVKNFDEKVIGSLWVIDSRIMEGCQAKGPAEWLVRRGLSPQQANCLHAAGNDLSIQAACCSDH